jgi:phosphate transport system protein
MNSVRRTFEEELLALRSDVLGLGEAVNAALDKAILALLTHDTALAEAVVAGDEAINALQGRIEHTAFLLLATQQPVASDLRTIMSASGIANDLERIGDYAKGIATITLRKIDAEIGPSGGALQELARLVRRQMVDIIAAFDAADPDAARAIAARDAEVDAQYGAVHRDLLRQMMAAPERVPELDRLMWISRSLERAGDHVTNLAERIVFERTGRVEELSASGTSLRD